MKKFLFVLLTFMLLVTSIKAQWKQSYLWSSAEIKLMSVVNDNIVWVKDSYGSKISITSDGCKTWTSKELPTIFNPFSTNGLSSGGITAINATTAYQLISQGTDMGIYKTTDAGTTWNKQLSGFNSTSSFPDIIYFWNGNEGVAVGDGNNNLKFEIYTTTNGGDTWSLVSTPSLISSTAEYTYNTNDIFRIKGNTIYFLTNNGTIMKSSDKGLTWSEITTPLTTIVGVSFDFKDELNGIITYPNGVFSTSDGGTTWSNFTTALYLGDVRYSSANNAYLSVGTTNLGYCYSIDNGQTWIQNPSFNNVRLGMIDVTSTGKVFIGGVGSVFYTDNYQSENIAVKNVALTGYNSIDVSYTKVPYLLNSTDTINYQISSIRLGKASKVLIKTITQDVGDKTLMHLTTDNNLPSDSIRLIIKNIYDLNSTTKGNPMLYNEPGNTTYFKNYSTISKTINITTPGSLGILISAVEKYRISQLTVTGIIDARDFRIMRDSLPALNVLDISATTIVAYTGTEGTYSTTSYSYLANEIPRQAFYRKSSLSSVILPNNITSIARSALNNCQSISSIDIPSGVTSIGQYAFAYCYQLSNITIPNTVTTLDIGAFQYSSSFYQVSLPSNLTTISDNCFRGTALTSISIPVSVKNIGNLVFNECKNLTSINVNALNNTYSSINGVLFDKNVYTLIRYPEGKTEISYEIPLSVTTISDFAFENTPLTSVSLPTSLSSIGTATFRNSSINSIFIPRMVSKIGSYPFFNCSNLNSIIVDALNLNFISVNAVLFDNTAKTIIAYPPGLAGSYTIPNLVTSIGNDAFGSCKKLTIVKIPSSVTAINDYAFEYCTLLDDISMPNTVVNIGSGAFSNCTSLASLHTFSTAPLDLSNSYSVFSQIPTTCTLYVPKGSLSLYQSANQWKDFSNIVEFDATAVSNPKNVNLKVFYNQATGLLQLNGIDSSASVLVYDLNGKLCVCKTIIPGESLPVQNLAKGIYVVKAVINNELLIQKVIL